MPVQWFIPFLNNQKKQSYNSLKKKNKSSVISINGWILKISMWTYNLIVKNIVRSKYIFVGIYFEDGFWKLIPNI